MTAVRNAPPFVRWYGPWRLVTVIDILGQFRRRRWVREYLSINGFDRWQVEGPDIETRSTT